MTNEVSFVIPGKPVGKESVGAGPGGRFVPPKSRGYISRVQMHAMLAMRGKEMFEGPVIVVIDVGVGMPKAWSSKRRGLMLDKETGLGPDLDNVQKSVLDGMANYVYKNDKQVGIVHVRKVLREDHFVIVYIWSANSEGPRRKVEREAWDLLLSGARRPDSLTIDQ